MAENKHESEVAYQINGSMLLHQEENEHGVEYTLFDCQTKQKVANGIISFLDLPNVPGPGEMSYARACAMQEIGLEVQSVHKVSLLMLEPFKESEIHERKLWCPESLPSDDIRFIDSRYNNLFMLPNGGFIQVEYPEETVIKQCVFIDPYHTQVGNSVFHICEYAECMERRGAIYQPEPEIMGDDAAWRISGDKYLVIQTCLEGYDYSLLDKNFLDLDGGVLENPHISMLEARAEILELLGLSPRELRVAIYEDVMEQHLEAEQQALLDKSAGRKSVMEQLTQAADKSTAPTKVPHKKQDMER